MSISLRWLRESLIKDEPPLLFDVLCIKFIQLFQSFVLIEALPRTSMIYSFKLLVISIVTVPAALLIVLLGLFDRDGKYTYGITRLWAWIILIIGGVRLKVAGLSHVDPKRQYIFMVNHQSHIDIPVLIQSLPSFQ